MLEKVSVSSLASFALVIIVGGLAQIWMLSVVLWSMDRPFSLSQLLGDGGLFFFTTSLFVSSFLELITRHRLKRGSADFNVSLFAAFMVGLPAITVYTSVLSANFGTSTPFAQNTTNQVALALGALIYAFYVAARTGQLKPRRRS